MKKKVSNRSIITTSVEDLEEVADQGEIFGLIYHQSETDGVLMFLVTAVDSSGNYDPDEHEVLAQIAVSCHDPEWMAIKSPREGNPALVPFYLLQMVNNLVTDPAKFASFFGTTSPVEA
jgi:hypothetical protein